jgi:hypothetical protein
LNCDVHHSEQDPFAYATSRAAEMVSPPEIKQGTDMTNLNNELSLDELDAVSGGDNFRGYAQINVLGLTVAVAEKKMVP